jgi:hypothetical protein
LLNFARVCCCARAIFWFRPAASILQSTYFCFRALLKHHNALFRYHSKSCKHLAIFRCSLRANANIVRW